MNHGYILIRLAKIGVEHNVIDYLMSLERNGTWYFQYCCHIFGDWDIMCEVRYENERDMEACLDILKKDENIRDLIEESIALKQINR